MGYARITESWTMEKAEGLNFVLSSDYLAAAGMVSLLSVLVLVGLFFYLNRYTGRKYFSTWTVGWLFYAAWLAFGPGLDTSPTVVMVKHWCVGISAALLFWGSVQFLKLPSRPLLFALFVGFLMAWSCVERTGCAQPARSARADIRGDRAGEPGDGIFIFPVAETSGLSWRGTARVWFQLVGNLPGRMSVLCEQQTIGRRGNARGDGAAIVHRGEHDRAGSGRSARGERNDFAADQDVLFGEGRFGG